VVVAHYKKRQSVKLLDQQFGYFRLPHGLSRRTRHCRSRAGARHGMCELTHGMAGERHGRGMLFVNRPLCSPEGQFEVAISNYKFPGVLTTTKTHWTAIRSTVSVAAMCLEKISQGYFRSQLSSCEITPNTQWGTVGCTQITPWNSSRPLFSAPCPKQHLVIIRFYVIWHLKLEESCQINQKQAIDLFRLINAQQLPPKPAVL